MRKPVQLFGLYLVLSGISGVIDHLWRQPFFGVFLNAFNRWIIPRVDALQGYEIYANLSLSVLGVVLIVVADRIGSAS